MSDMHHPDCPHSHEPKLRHRTTAGGGCSGGGVREFPSEMNKAIEAVRFISAHLKNEDDYDEVGIK